MVDVVQVVLVVAIFIITIILVALGIQLFHLLKEVRLTVQKANRMLDRTHTLFDSVANPFSSLSSLMKGTSLLSVVKLAKRLLSSEEKG